MNGDELCMCGHIAEEHRRCCHECEAEDCDCCCFDLDEDEGN